MGKFGQAVVKNSNLDSGGGKDEQEGLYLKKQQAEAEIRMKLDKFAKELSKAQNKRSKH